MPAEKMGKSVGFVFLCFSSSYFELLRVLVLLPLVNSCLPGGWPAWGTRFVRDGRAGRGANPWLGPQSGACGQTTKGRGSRGRDGGRWRQWVGFRPVQVRVEGEG